MKTQKNRILVALALLCAGKASALLAAEGEHPVDRNYVTAPPAPASQTDESVQTKSAGCLTCHTQTDATTMHSNPAVNLGCTDCHGGNSSVRLTGGAQRGSDAYTKAFESAHVLPRFPKSWHYPSSANPERTYTLLNRESPEFVRFINPSDYRIAQRSLRRVSHGDHRSVGAQPAFDRRDAVGRRGVQQRHPRLQAIHPRRGVRPQWQRDRAEGAEDSRSPDRRRRRSRASCRSSIRCRRGNRSSRATSSACSSAAAATSRTCSPKPACRTRRVSCSGSRSRADPTSVNRIAARARARASPCR